MEAARTTKPAIRPTGPTLTSRAGTVATDSTASSRLPAAGGTRLPDHDGTRNNRGGDEVHIWNPNPAPGQGPDCPIGHPLPTPGPDRR